MKKHAKSSAKNDRPWTAEVGKDGFFRVVNAQSFIIAQKCVKEEAVLFAAAPELLDAACLALTEIEHWNDVMGGSEDPRTHEAIIALKTSIAAAYGKHS